MEQFFQVTDISSAIQLAVAPVFLLAGISGDLNVMTHRLGRIVDRGRFLKDKKAVCDEAERILVNSELKSLTQRATLTNWAISLSTCCALLICLVIVVLFIGAVMNLEVGIFIAFLFVIAMLCLILALVLYLKEISLSTSAFMFYTE